MRAAAFAEARLWNHEARDLVEDRFLVLAPLHTLIAVQQTIPHASTMAPIARTARRPSGSISMSPISRRLANASARATRKAELKLTSGGPCQTSAVRTLS